MLSGFRVSLVRNCFSVCLELVKGLVILFSVTTLAVGFNSDFLNMSLQATMITRGTLGPLHTCSVPR